MVRLNYFEIISISGTISNDYDYARTAFGNFCDNPLCNICDFEREQYYGFREICKEENFCFVSEKHFNNEDKILNVYYDNKYYDSENRFILSYN